MVLDGEVDLISYRNEKTFDGSSVLQVGETAAVYGAGDVGTGKVNDAKAPLSTIIEVINERFGTNWTDEDKLLFDQISGDMNQDAKLTEQARVNSKEQFRQVFEPQVMEAFVKRHGRNEKIVSDFMSNEEMRKLIIGALLEDVYGRARAEGVRR